MSAPTPTSDTPLGEDAAPVKDSPPLPGAEGGLVGLLRDNLFKDLKNTVTTLIFGGAALYVLYRAAGFLLFNSKQTPDGDTVNSWRVIRDELITYMVGTEYTDAVALPFLWAAIYVFALAMGIATAPVPDADGNLPPPTPLRARLGMLAPPVLAALLLVGMARTPTPAVLTALIAVPVILGMRLPDKVGVIRQRRTAVLCALALLGFLLETGFNPGNLNEVGGLLLTVNVAFISIVLCFPIGIVLALTRRSDLVILKPLAILFIELIRGVPLISLLFIGQFALAFFLPAGADAPSPVFRAIFMITIFSAAYVAEIIRGGLQSVPNGQDEAGRAVGLSGLQITSQIILPQALRNSIPPLVGQFIALLKDTTLVTIIGLFDVLGVGRRVVTNPTYQNQGYAPEVYAFVAFLFWVMCFSMSRASQRLETRLGVGER